jgi:twinkle protein
MEINGFEIDKFNVHGFDLQNKTSGNTVSTCAFCSADRKPEHKKQKCCKLNLDIGWYTCLHCGRTGQLHTFKSKNKGKEKKKIYKKPDWKNYTALSDKVVKYFEDERCINQTTLMNSQIKTAQRPMPPKWEKKLTICFPYFKFGEVANIKYRTNDKQFILVKDAELVFYNYDSIIQSKECLIVEGEIDCLTWIQAGYPFVVSVPNGAATGKLTLDYLDSAIAEGIFDNKEKIYLGGDDDEPGINLRNELLRRLGAERCYKVVYENCKDANQFYVEHCKKTNAITANEKLMQCLTDAEMFPIKGIISLTDCEDELDLYFQNGLPRGYRLPFEGVDNRIETGRILTITGIPQHGKTAVVNELIAYFATVYKWKTGIFTPETYPSKLFYALLIQTLVARSFHTNKISLEVYKQAKEFVHSWFKFIYPDDFKLNTILEIAKQLVYRDGIKVLVLDAYNNIEHEQDKFERDDRYVERFYIRLHEFVKRHDIFLILVAHPTKIDKNKDGEIPVPTAYNIKGGSGHYEKADFIMCPYRDFKEKITTIFFQKWKFRHLGEVCNEVYKFNPESSRFHIRKTGVPDMSNWIIHPPHHVNEVMGQILEDNDFNEDIANIDNSNEVLPF